MPSENKSKGGSLRDALAAALPQRFKCKVRYIYTPSKRCDPLFSPVPGQEPEITRLASHLLAFSVDNSSSSTDGNVIVYAVEALVYTSKKLTTIFVSKADSSGYLPRQQPSPVQTITTTFLRWLSNREQRRRPNRKLIISLFARSQSQYLFPGSAENPKKHVLDDRQLVKWWARVLNPLIPPASDQDSSSEYDGYITVPGFERPELRPFFPHTRVLNGGKSCWHAGDPLVELAETRGVPTTAPPRCLLPRFPDDPKARYLQDLDDEAGILEDTSSTTSPSKRRNGRWASVRDLQTFWETMAFRQECSSGRLVGFIWLIIRPKASTQPHSNDDRASSPDSAASAATSGKAFQESAPANSTSPDKSSRSKTLTGPIITRKPRLKGGSSSLASSDLGSMASVDTSNGLLLSQEGYDRIMQLLMHLDFANLEVAIQSTKKWINDVSSTAGLSSDDWALEIEGRATAPLGKVEPALASASAAQQVNDLGGMIRKKRKVEDVSAEGDARVEPVVEHPPAINVLGSGMIRKKPKPMPS